MNWTLIKLILWAFVFAVFLCIPWQGHGSEITIGPLWQNVSAGPYGQGIRGRSTVTEIRATAYAPILWGSLIVRLPHKYASEVHFADKTTIGGVEFDKDDPVQFDGQFSMQQAKIGTYARVWAKPYLTVIGFTEERNLVQASKGKEKRHSEIKTQAWVGGGLRVDVPVTPRLLVYGDGWLLNKGSGIQGGIEYRYGRYFCAGYYENARTRHPDMTLNGVGLQAGVRF